MGHSPKVHLERYHKHTKAQQHKEAIDRVLSQPNRPIVPIVDLIKPIDV